MPPATGRQRHESTGLDAGSLTTAAGHGRPLARYGHMVPLRGVTRLIRYLSTAESTQELLTM